jgi:membrane protein
VDVKSIAGRVLASPPVAFVMAVLDTYGAAAGGLLANGLAFAALFAALPTTLLILGLAGIVASEQAFQAELAARLAQAFPPLADLFEDALAAVSQGAGVSSIIGFVGVVWGVSQFYGTIDTAFARIFAGVPERDFAGRTLRGFIWVLLLVGIVIAAVVVATLSSFLEGFAPDRAPITRTIAAIISSPLTILVLSIVVVALLYRVLPATAPRWRSIAPPAVIVGVAITLLTQLFSLLVPFLVGAAAIVGSLAAGFVALAWLSFVFQALLYGAAWVRVSEVRAAQGAADQG